jgi:hypothetical protein
MYWYDTLIRYSLWFLLFISLWLVLFPLFSTVNLKKIRFNRLIEIKKREKSPFYRKLEVLLATTLNVEGSFAVYSFIFLLFTIAIMTFTGFIQNTGNITQALFWSLITPLFLIAFLFYRLRNLRIKTSHEGHVTVTEILNNYRIFHKNILEALDHTVTNLKRYPSSQNVLSRLSMGLKEYQTEEELLQLISDFQYSLNTTWGVMLSNSIYNAVLYGDNIEDGLTDVIDQLKDLERLNEKNKQINLEGLLLLQIFIPLMLIGSVFMMIKYFGFTFQKFIQYQFFETVGFYSFFYTAISILVTILVFIYLRKEKNDY